MGAPKVSSAIFTISMARTTPAQNPRGLSNNTRFWLGEVAFRLTFERFSTTEEVTHSVYQCATCFEQLIAAMSAPPQHQHFALFPDAGPRLHCCGLKHPHL